MINSMPVTPYIYPALQACTLLNKHFMTIKSFAWVAISSIFVILAAICKAGADTLAHHFGRSIFSDKNPEFWNPEVSWRTAKIIFAYKWDGWHLFNSGMIFFFILAIISHAGIIGFFWKPSINSNYSQKDWTRRALLCDLADFTILSFLFIMVFNTFYNHIFIH